MLFSMGIVCSGTSSRFTARLLAKGNLVLEFATLIFLMIGSVLNSSSQTGPPQYIFGRQDHHSGGTSVACHCHHYTVLPSLCSIPQNPEESSIVFPVLPRVSVLIEGGNL